MSGELVAAQMFVVYAASDRVIHFHDSSDFNEEALIEWHRIKFHDGVGMPFVDEALWLEAPRTNCQLLLAAVSEDTTNHLQYRQVGG